MEKFELQKLRDLPIEEIANRLGLTVTKHKALCPFHQDQHPSLSFHTGRNTYKCFVCDAHGGVIDLAMHLLGKNFKDTCSWLASQHGVGSMEYGVGKRIPNPYTLTDDKPRAEPSSLELCRGAKEEKQQSCLNPKPYTFNAQRYERYFARPFLNKEARAFLFQERKLHPAVVRWCRLHSYTDRHGTPWLQIPYYDVEGHLIGVQSRRLKGVECREEGVGNHPDGHPKPYTLNPKPRFIFPSGSKISIYNLPVLKMLKEGEDLWIAEGCSDCWALLSSGHKAIAIPSATLLRKKDLETLNPKLSTLNLHMYPDADIPGEKLFLQLKAHFPQLVRHSLPTGCKDYSELYVRCREYGVGCRETVRMEKTLNPKP